MNKISIVTAFYNGNEYIEKLLDSIQSNVNQCKKHIKIESVIVNDSPKCKLNIDEVKYDFEIRMINNIKNMGIHASRINGIKAATGDYVIIIDQDDVLTECAIISQMSNIRDSDVCVGNGFQIFSDRKNKIFKHKGHQKLVQKLGIFLYYGTPIISPGQCLIRKKSIPNLWLENPIEINGSDDEILWILMHLQESKFTLNFTDVYHHVFTGKNASEDYEKMAESSLAGIKLLDLQGKITSQQRSKFIRRRMMKKERYKQSTFKKILINAKYLDLSLYIIKIKALKKMLR